MSHMRRIVIEEVEPCHHGKMYSHRWAWSGWCPGSTTLARTVLTEPSEEMVARGAMAHAEASGFISPPDDGHDAMRAALTAALFSSDNPSSDAETVEPPAQIPASDAERQFIARWFGEREET